MEHLNRLVKEAVKILGAIKTEKAISRVGCAIGTIAPVLSKFDQENLQTPAGTHRTANYERDRNVVVSELCYINVFNTESGRRHHLFPNHITFFVCFFAVVVSTMTFNPSGRILRTLPIR